MNLQQYIQSRNGKVVGDGECGSLVRDYWNTVEHITPPSYPSAKDYWYNPAPPYVHTSNPNPGDIAVYDAHGAFPDGHIAVYIGNGEVFEQNADPDGSPAHVFTRSTQYLLGYLTLGEDMTTEQATKIALYARLLAFQSVAEANAENASDVPYIQASADNIGQLLEDLYKSQGWQSHNKGATKLAPGLYEV